jgi:hypothetical protein
MTIRWVSRSRGRHQHARLRRAGVLAIVLTSTAVLTAACGGVSSSSIAAAGTTAYQKALAFSECMRSHGVPNYPDPNSNGQIVIQGQNLSGSPGQAGIAQNACQHLLANGGQINGAQQQDELSQSLKYAACMRSHGIPNFPDPSVVNGGGAIGQQLPPGLTPSSPQFQAANQACRQYQPGGRSSS